MGLRLSEISEILCESGRQLIDWLSQYKFFVRKRIEIGVNTDSLLKLRLYTAETCYTIVCSERLPPREGCYLGCVATKRKPRPGETWTRGNDLPDGEFGEGMLERILGAIVFYEAKDVAKEIVRPQDTTANIGPALGHQDIKKGYNPPPQEGVKLPENPPPSPPPKLA